MCVCVWGTTHTPHTHTHMYNVCANVCMCACVCVCVCICVYVCVFNIFIFLPPSVLVGMIDRLVSAERQDLIKSYIEVCVYVHVCTCVYVHVCMYMCVHVCLYRVL